MVPCHFCIYSIIVHSLASSIASSNRGYYRFQSSTQPSVITVVRRAALWWNPSSTIIIAPVTTQLSLPYSTTFCATAFYGTPWARTVAPVFISTSGINPHYLQDFCRLWYMAAQYLLLYVMMRRRYRKASVGSSGSSFTLMETRFPQISVVGSPSESVSPL